MTPQCSGLPLLLTTLSSHKPQQSSPTTEEGHGVDLVSSLSTNTVVERWVCCTAVMCVVCDYSQLHHYGCVY